jgi:hypothetical protein
MFNQTFPIEPRLAAAVAGLEEHESGMRVVSAQIYKAPYLELEVSVAVQRPRPFDVLEEFVLRAANELRPQPSKAGLAKLLGLDPLFLDATVATLIELEALKNSADGPIVLTAKGAKFYSQGSVPQPLERKSARLVYRCLTNTLGVPSKSVVADNGAAVLPGFDMKYWTVFSTQASEAVTLENMIAVSTQAGLGWHEPAAGNHLVQVKITEAPGQFVYEYYGVLVVQDTGVADLKTDNVSVRVIDLQSGREVVTLTNLLTQWLKSGQAKLTAFFGEAQIDAGAGDLPPNAIRAHDNYAEQLKVTRQGSKPTPKQAQTASQAPASGTVELLPGSDIRARFLGMLEKATHTVILVVPWITEDVIDAEFRRRLTALASRNVRIVIGWGMAKQRGREAHPPSAELLDELDQIKSPEGLPIVSIWWLGSRQGRDVLVDNSLHLTGSQNWLSYGGERMPVGEAVYFITSPDLVTQAATSIEVLFVARLDVTWQTAIQDDAVDADTIEHLCVTLIALRQYDVALQHILTLAADEKQAALSARLFQTVLMAVAAQPVQYLLDANFFDTLLIALPEMNRIKTALPAEVQSEVSFIASLRKLVKRYADNDPAGLAVYLDGARNLWEQVRLLPAGTSGDQYVAELSQAKTVETIKKKKK